MIPKENGVEVRLQPGAVALGEHFPNLDRLEYQHRLNGVLTKPPKGTSVSLCRKGDDDNKAVDAP